MLLQPVEIAIELGYQGEREPHIDNHRWLTLWTAYRLLACGLCPSLPLRAW